MLLEQIQPRQHSSQEETLYHKDVGFPSNLDMPRGFTPVLNLRYGGHAKEQALADKYGNINLPHRVDIRKGEIFEIGARGNVVSKIGVRFKYDDQRDMIMIINPSDGFVRTVWFNTAGDQHKTLDKSKYARPQQRVAH